MAVDSDRPRAILIVEDDPAIRELLEACLTGEGYRAVAVPTVAAALSALAQERFDLVLTDTMDAKLDEPWGLLGAVRDAAAPAPVAICTAHDQHAFADYRARGFAAFIGKPFDLDELDDVVAALLAGATGDGAG